MVAHTQWQSDLSADQIFAQGENFQYPTPYQGGILYLCTLKEQAGRLAIKYVKNQNDPASAVCITPESFSLRTKINEYGGKPYWLYGDCLWFANQSDQRLYKQDLDISRMDDLQPPVAVTPRQDDEQLMFAELSLLNEEESMMVAIVETEFKQSNDKENSHRICAFNTATDTDADINKKCLQTLCLQTLVEGADFYSNLVVDVERQRIAWVQWDHPNMPWDDTQLWVAELEVHDSQVSLFNQRQIELERPACFCQLRFAKNGRLFFSADFAGADSDSPDNYWNIKAIDLSNDKISSVTAHKVEFGYPHWQYGDERIVQFDSNTLLAVGSSPQGDSIYSIDQTTLDVSELSLFEAEIPDETKRETKVTLQNLGADGEGRVAAILSSEQRMPAMILINSDATYYPTVSIEKWLENDSVFSSDNISCAEHFEYQTKDGCTAYAFYYPPINADYRSATPPPLIVMVHGGPTGRAYGHFDIQKQFWTNRGFAILDVNHRGSSGYGRRYRDDLYGQWGLRDTEDIIDGIQALIEQGKADASAICIRGKSAGGYAVLRALTEYPDIFKAGACYYGIGNLATLAEVTHKFEKYYTDRLIGEVYKKENAHSQTSLFYQRSPSYKMEQVKSSMIVFQGLQDKVVPPSVAKEIIDMLEKANVVYRYIEYPDEGHGFRQVSNNIDALSKELDFYKSVLSQ